MALTYRGAMVSLILVTLIRRALEGGVLTMAEQTQVIEIDDEEVVAAAWIAT